MLEKRLYVLVYFFILVMQSCYCDNVFSGSDIKQDLFLLNTENKNNDINIENESDDTDTFASRLKRMNIPDHFKLKELYIGDKNAPLELIIYFSYTCPHCRKFHNKELPKFIKKYVDTKRVRIIFRNYLDDQGALEAAQIVRCFCKDDVNEYMKLSQRILNNQEAWLKSDNPHEFLKNIFVSQKEKNQIIKKKDIECCLKRTNIGAGLMIEQKRAMHQYGLTSMPAFIFKQQIWIGAITCEELEEFCGLIDSNNK